MNAKRHEKESEMLTQMHGRGGRLPAVKLQKAFLSGNLKTNIIFRITHGVETNIWKHDSHE